MIGERDGPLILMVRRLLARKQASKRTMNGRKSERALAAGELEPLALGS